MLNNSVTRKLLKSNQLGTSTLFGIPNEHNCFKSQLSVCTDNFEQYSHASILTKNDLERFIITWKAFTPLKNDRQKLSVVLDFWLCSIAKKTQKPGNAGNQQTAL